MSTGSFAPPAVVEPAATSGTRTPQVIAWSVGGVSVVLPMLGITWWAVTAPVAREPLFASPILVIGLTFGVVGASLIARLPANRLGWVLAVIGVCAGANVAAQGYVPLAAAGPWGTLPGPAVGGWFIGWSWVPPFVLFGTLVLQLFPDGRPVSPRWRLLSAWTVALAAAMAVTAAFAPGPVGLLSTHANPYAFLPFDLESAGAVLFPLLTATIVASVVSLAIRYRRGGPDMRRQTTWFAAAVVPAVLVMAGGEPLLGDVYWPVNTVLAGSVPLVMAVAILRRGLFTNELLVDRALVSAVVLAGLAVAYGVTVGGLAALAGAYGPGHAFAGGVVVALVFHPLRVRVQRQVDRLLYGDRAEPYAVLTSMGARLQHAAAPREALEGLVDALAEGLRLPGVAIEVTDGERTVLRTETGQLDSAAVVLPLAWQGEHVGRLVVMPRTNTVSLEQVDARLLRQLADHVAVVLYAVRLTADLQRSREGLVTAREEERRRLRRDLHDGLGPALAGIVMSLDAARHVVTHDAHEADRLLVAIRDEAQQAIGDIRQLVYGLRPPALDDLGLVGALQAAGVGASGHEDGDLRVAIEVSGDLDDLPAAAEVAAFRIAQEALTNIRRHAHASMAWVRITRSDVLDIEIADDGIGIPARVASGVGLASMRERAAELSGTCIVGRGPHGGTRVHVRLPLPVTA